MLDPDYLERAGEEVSLIYRAVEDAMLVYLASQIGKIDFTDSQKAMTAIFIAAHTAAPQLRKILSDHSDEISQKTRDYVIKSLKLADERDKRIIERAIGQKLKPLTVLAPDLIQSTIVGVSEIMARNNLLMEEGAKQAFISASTEAITHMAAGYTTSEKALRRAVRNLARDGIKIVSYQDPTTGKPTVVNHADVAVRRHLRSQLSQQTMRVTEARTKDAGLDLVEVTSHTGSRPSHAEWQGRIYSLSGTHPVYPDFAEGTGYYGTGKYGALGDRLGGVNCRHSFLPHIEGGPRYYEPDPQHPSGRSNEEIYGLTQKQRYRERKIRQAKRERDCAISAGLPEEEIKRLKEKVSVEQRKMRELISQYPDVLQRSPRREWAGDRPIFPIMTRKKKPNRKFEPMSDKEFYIAKDMAKQPGGNLKKANKEQAKYLKSVGAEGATWGLHAFVLPDASFSAALEEAIHVQQNAVRLNSERDIRMMYLLNELDAKNKLLTLSLQYNVDIDQIEETKQGIIEVEQALERLRRENPDVYNYKNNGT